MSEQTAGPYPLPWRTSSAASFVLAASAVRAAAAKLEEPRIGAAMSRAMGAVLGENGFPNPDDPRPPGPGGPVEGLATAASLLDAAAQLRTGPVRAELVATAKRFAVIDSHGGGG